MNSYDDGHTRLDDTGVLLRRYWFPFGRAKHIRWDQVRAAHTAPLTLLNGRWRGWGSGTPMVWLGLDMRRYRRSTLMTLDVGKRIRPGFTPHDPPAALRVLTSHVQVSGELGHRNR